MKGLSTRNETAMEVAVVVLAAATLVVILLDTRMQFVLWRLRWNVLQKFCDRSLALFA